MATILSITQLFFILLFFSNSIARAEVMVSPVSRIHDYETTRLKSTAGSGVASILMDESAIFNPAPIAFFNISSIYIQKSNVEYHDNLNLVQSNVSKPSDDSKTYAGILSDAKGDFKGSISYQKQREWQNERKRISISTAFPIGKVSSVGINFRHTNDFLAPQGGLSSEKSYNQFSLGALHITESGLSIGVIVTDPLEKNKDDRFAILGLQYMFTNVFAIMADVGSDYKENLSDEIMYRGAIQVNFFSDFYLRAGFFRDLHLDEKGTGVGIGWVTPKLMVEAALKNTTFIYDLNRERVLALYYPKDMKEVSFSLSLRF